MINNKFIDGQLDECNLTLREIDTIASTFVRVLSAMYHGRVKYPENLNGNNPKKSSKEDPHPSGKILKAAKAAFRKLEFTQWGLSIVFVGTKRMRAINKKYLDHDYVTDVLTFDLGEGAGEIIICPQIGFR